MQAQRPDFVQVFFGWFFMIGAFCVALAFGGNWIWSRADPAGYAADQAHYAAQRQAEDAAKGAEARRIRDQEQHQREEEAAYAVYWAHAKDSYENFKRTLADPSGAQFRDVWAVKFSRGGAVGSAVCGVVNAKNAFGAYVGDRPFIAVGGQVWTPERPDFEIEFKGICLEGTKMERIR